MTKVILVDSCDECPYIRWKAKLFSNPNIDGIYSCLLLDQKVIENPDAYPPTECPLESYYPD